MRYAVAALAVIVVVAIFLASRKVRDVHAYLQRQHPVIWAKYQFPDTSEGWVKPKDDSRMASAQFAYWFSVWSGELRRLNDSQLNELLRQQSLLQWLALAALLLFAVCGFALDWE